MEKIQISLNDLIDIIKEYELDIKEKTPLDCIGFCNYIFNLYFRERSNRKDLNIHMKDIGNPNECSKIGHLNSWFPKEKTICLRCGEIESPYRLQEDLLIRDLMASSKADVDKDLPLYMIDLNS